MKLLKEEIIRFIYSITPKERRKNPRLKKKIENLIELIDQIPLPENRTREPKRDHCFRKDIL